MTSWDERYRRGEHDDRTPLDVVVRAAGALEPGRALDLACGTGRHALYLAQRGWRVTALDASAVAIGILRERAQALGVEVDARVADLEAPEFEIEPAAYDLICDCCYLQRDLFPKMRSGVRAGGVIVAAIPMVDDAPGLKPMSPAFLVESGELRKYLDGGRVLHEWEGRRREGARRIAEIVVQRIA